MCSYESFNYLLSVILTVLATAAEIIRLAQSNVSIRKLNITNRVVLVWHVNDIFCVAALALIYLIAMVILWGAVKKLMRGHSILQDESNLYKSVTPIWVTIAQVRCFSL